MDAVGRETPTVELRLVLDRLLEHDFLEQPVAKVRVRVARVEVVDAVEGNGRRHGRVGLLEAGLERAVARR